MAHQTISFAFSSAKNSTTHTVLRNGYILFLEGTNKTSIESVSDARDKAPPSIPFRPPALVFLAQPLVCAAATLRPAFQSAQVPQIRTPLFYRSPRRAAATRQQSLPRRREGTHAPDRFVSDSRFLNYRRCPCPPGRPHLHLLASGGGGLAHAAPMPEQHTQHDRWIIRGVLAFGGGGGGVAVILGSTRRSAKMATTPAPRTQWSYKEGPEANTRIDSSAIYY